MKINIYIKLILGGFFFLPPSVSKATHIVGGEMTYKFAKREGANNKDIRYNFSLRVYRESNSAAGFDYRPIISIFIKQSNGQYKLLRSNFPFLSDQYDVQPPKLPCTQVPSGIAVETGIYNWQEVFRDTNTSYMIVWQRCCRNGSISNIFWGGGNVGATYFIELTPEAQRTNNSSPEFQQLPPIFICGNEALRYDHSAKDVDGHQLVYRFCPSFEGGSAAQPTPNPSSTPPFAPIQYFFPYTYSAPMGGNPVVKIDPNTGLITGTPDVLGQFVVTICVEEYDNNGVLLSTVFRDFQFNVVSCKRLVVSKLDADSIFGKKFSIYRCDSATLNINNTSFDRANVNSFYWEFNNNGGQITRYTDWSPSVFFRDTGRYTGKLVLNPGGECSDSAFVEVNIGGKITPKIRLNYDTCVAGPVRFEGQVATSVPLSKIAWSFGDLTRDSNKLKTAHLFAKAGVFTSTLSVVDIYGCKGNTTETFTWKPAPPILIVEPSAFIGCLPSQVFFKNSSSPLDTTYKVAWDFGDGSTSNQVSPKHIYTRADSFTVKLTITSPIGCKKDAIFKNWIKIKPNPTADFDWSPKILNNLHPSVKFEDKSSTDVIGWRWFFSDKAYSNQKNPTFTYRDTGVQTIKLYVTGQNGCKDSIIKTIHIEPEMTFYIPNAFSPNDDSVNDVFKGTGFLYGLKSFRMTIWNRWGEKIFETTNVNEGWNGQKNNIGQQVLEGVYLCDIEYITPQNERKKLNNYLTLYR